MISPASHDVAQQLVARLPHLRRLWQPGRRLAELQLDSLDTVELLMLLDELYGVRLRAEDMQPATTIEQFCQLVAERAGQAANAALAAPILDP